jgi:hypothetical protein
VTRLSPFGRASTYFDSLTWLAADHDGTASGSDPAAEPTVVVESTWL